MLCIPDMFYDHQCCDHLGNVYSSVKEMCDAYHVPISVFVKRLASGKYGFKQALITPVIRDAVVCNDHLGNKFDSITAMCKHYSISCATYLSRVRRGWGIERALTTPVAKNAYKFKYRVGK